jgi:hypothetical protein
MTKPSQRRNLELPQTFVSLQNCTSTRVSDSREHFFKLNRVTIEYERPNWISTLEAYRSHYRNEALQKHQILSYTFHLRIYCHPRMRYPELENALQRDQVNPDVLRIPEYARSGMIYLFERILVTNQSNLHRWW